MMKVERSESFEETDKPLDIAKYLVLLSRAFTRTEPKMVTNQSEGANHFECKTCNRKFQSFQALGGHRASHRKRPRSESSDQEQEQEQLTKKKRSNNDEQTHKCSMCGQSFGSGQALGGHMRRHRTTTHVSEPPARALCPTAHGTHVLKRCNSSKRVFSLDLNLTPLENDLEYVFGKALAPKIDMKFVS